MNLHSSSDPVTRKHQRIEFAKRLASHRVRTGTIRLLSGLSLSRLAGLRKGWGIPPETRLRGKGPRTLDRFLKHPEARAGSAVILSVCRIFNAFPERRRDYTPDGTLNLESGIRLLDAFEAYHACQPGSNLEFDEFLLLINELERGQEVRLGRCKRCRALIVIATYTPGKKGCSHCE